MTDKEAIKGLQNIVEYWTLNPHEQEVAEYAISALKEREERSNLTPCDVCRYGPPSCADGKPCTMCPAVGADR